MLNILKGEMSIIGPRPFLSRELMHMQGHADTILSVKPGMAGPWIANGRNKVPFEERLMMEHHYAQNWSLWVDLRLFFKSLLAVTRGDGAY